MARLSLLKYDRDATLADFNVNVSEFRVPLKMHIGAPCKAAVEKGASVKKGTVIGTPEGLGALIHAPVDGTVSVVTPDMVVIKAGQST
jgi:Na+-translocating ferredoxin:NAD+ oxidoreductase RnfC subunit